MPRSGTRAVPTRERENEAFPGRGVFGLEIGKFVPPLSGPWSLPKVTNEPSD
jgi:hypothetical protein